MMNFVKKNKYVLVAAAILLPRFQQPRQVSQPLQAKLTCNAAEVVCFSQQIFRVVFEGGAVDAFQEFVAVLFKKRDECV